MEVGLRNNSSVPLNTDIWLCLQTGWSWHELMATPAWVVRDLKVYFEKRSVIDRERERMRGKGGG